MSKCKKAIWISTLKGQLGIIHTVADDGETRVLVGITSGSGDEQRDIQQILDYGGRIRLQDAESIVKHLKENKDENRN